MTTTRDVEHTARDTAIAQWGIASVVMVGSMVAGGVAFHCLGEPAALGVITALGVDLALAGWIRISARLRALGITSVPGRVLEIASMFETLYLNVGAAVFQRVIPHTWSATVLLGIAHGFLPITLVLAAFAGGDAQLKLLRVRREREAQQQAEREQQLTADRAAYEANQKRLAAELIERRRAELEQARHDAEIDAIRNASPTPPDDQRGASVTRLPKRRKPGRRSTAQARHTWIEQRLRAGHDVTGADVKTEFPDASNSARDVATVKTRLAQRPSGGRSRMEVVDA